MSDSNPHPDEVVKADTYRHSDGTLEVVVATTDDRVLTVRDYGSVADFEDAVDAAAYRGTHEDIAALADPEELAEGLTTDDE